MDYVNLTLIIGSFVALCVIFYRIVVKKKKVSTIYTPYDDFTRGTHDTNRSVFLEEDTNHSVPYEQVSKREPDE